MQETNSQLQKTLERVNTQNTESAKQLAVANEQARTLEQQLAAAKNKGTNRGVIIVVLLLALIAK
jgi:septal ring factor EnvC (AmiA/AmiB activator)